MIGLRRDAWIEQGTRSAGGPGTGSPGGAGQPGTPAMSSTRRYRADAVLAARSQRWAPWAMAVLRIGAGLLFMQHGAQKLLGLFGGFGPDGGAAPLFSQMGLAGVLELGGGAAIVLGLFTRPIAALLVLEMIWAYVQAHLPQGGLPIQNGGELALLYALTLGFLAVAGPGRWSVDARVQRRPAR